MSQGSVYSNDSIIQEEEDHSDVLREKTQFHNRISEESTPSTSKDNQEKSWTPKTLSEPQQGESTTADPKSPNENDENKFEGCEQPLNSSTKLQQIENLPEGGKISLNPTKIQPAAKIVSIAKVSSLKEEEILQLASSIEKDVAKICYRVARGKMIIL